HFSPRKPNFGGYRSTMRKKRVQAKTSARGYGTEHQRLRRHLDKVVQAGNAYCWRCLKEGKSRSEAWIPPGPWHLGHDDLDRSKYRGPEHVACNTGAANKNRRRSSRDW